MFLYMYIYICVCFVNMLNKLVFLYLNVYFNLIILCAIVICDPGAYYRNILI